MSKSRFFCILSASGGDSELRLLIFNVDALWYNDIGYEFNMSSIPSRSNYFNVSGIAVIATALID